METIENNTQKKVSFITLGCKVNQYDSDAMRTLLYETGMPRQEKMTMPMCMSSIPALLPALVTGNPGRWCAVSAGPIPKR